MLGLSSCTKPFDSLLFLSLGYSDKLAPTRSWIHQVLICLPYVGLSPFPVIVTTRIISCLVGDSYKPSFATITGKGDNPRQSDLAGIILASLAEVEFPKEAARFQGAGGRKVSRSYFCWANWQTTKAFKGRQTRGSQLQKWPEIRVTVVNDHSLPNKFWNYVPSPPVGLRFYDLVFSPDWTNIIPHRDLSIIPMSCKNTRALKNRMPEKT